MRASYNTDGIWEETGKYLVRRAKYGLSGYSVAILLQWPSGSSRALVARRVFQAVLGSGGAFQISEFQFQEFLLQGRCQIRIAGLRAPAVD